MIRTTQLRHTVTQGLAALVACLGLTGGIASAQLITNTGPGSTNRITDNITNNCRLINTNNLSVSNYNDQTATTGSTNVSGNTTAGVPWSGWSALDPTVAQANGESFAAWRADVATWLAQRASGSDWNSTGTNLNWSPGSTSWSAWDPLSWQANGQSFANWHSGVQAYIGRNSGQWALTWPSTATGGSNLGSAVSGNASNSSNANFSINISNTVPALGMAVGSGTCARVAGGGSSGGGGPTSTPSHNSHGVVAGASTARGSGSGGGFGGSFIGGSRLASSAPSAHLTTSHPTTPSVPSGSGKGAGGGTTPSSTGSHISNTGPGSANTIASNVTNNSTVVNRNCVTVTNVSHQTAITGSANVSSNTTTGSGDSGSASNNNGTGAGVGVTN